MVTIEAFISKFPALANFIIRNNKATGRCPFHDDKNPSAWISEEGGKVRLFCKVCTDMTNGLDEYDLNERWGGSIDKPCRKKSFNLLASRGFKVSYKFRVQCQKNGFVILDDDDKNAVEYYIDKKRVAWVVNTEKKAFRYRFARNWKKAPLGKTGEKTVIVEGMLDALAILHMGFENVIMLGGAEYNVFEQIDLTGIKHLILALDNDDMGNQCKDKIIGKMKNKNLEIKIMSMEQGQDPVDLMRSGKPPTLQPVNDLTLKQSALYLVCSENDKYLLTLKDLSIKPGFTQIVQAYDPEILPIIHSMLEMAKDKQAFPYNIKASVKDRSDDIEALGIQLIEGLFDMFRNDDIIESSTNMPKNIETAKELLTIDDEQKVIPSTLTLFSKHLPIYEGSINLFIMQTGGGKTAMMTSIAKSLPKDRKIFFWAVEGRARTLGALLGGSEHIYVHRGKLNVGQVASVAKRYDIIFLDHISNLYNPGGLSLFNQLGDTIMHYSSTLGKTFLLSAQTIKKNIDRKAIPRDAFGDSNIEFASELVIGATRMPIILGGKAMSSTFLRVNKSRSTENEGELFINSFVDGSLDNTYCEKMEVDGGGMIEYDDTYGHVDEPLKVAKAVVELECGKKAKLKRKD